MRRTKPSHGARYTGQDRPAYQVRGIWYAPADDPSYDETGIASWYGPNGHRDTTANGERFDGRRVGAAHRTLPLPCYVEVTALPTGRRILVRINDRGPFVAGRIIDLSYAAAELLGIARVGTARVRVRRVYPGERDRRLLRAGRPAIALSSAPVALAPGPVPGYSPRDTSEQRIDQNP